MEFGSVPELHQFQAEEVKKSVIVQEVDPSLQVHNKQDPKDVMVVQNEEEPGKIDTNKVEAGKFDTYNQVTLTNLNFGYNPESKDFFVKVQRGDFEAQYPTDEMMKLKAALAESAEDASSNEAS